MTSSSQELFRSSVIDKSNSDSDMDLLESDRDVVSGHDGVECIPSSPPPEQVPVDHKERMAESLNFVVQTPKVPHDAHQFIHSTPLLSFTPLQNRNLQQKCNSSSEMIKLDIQTPKLPSVTANEPSPEGQKLNLSVGSAFTVAETPCGVTSAKTLNSTFSGEDILDILFMSSSQLENHISMSSDVPSETSKLLSRKYPSQNHLSTSENHESSPQNQVFPLQNEVSFENHSVTKKRDVTSINFERPQKRLHNFFSYPSSKRLSNGMQIKSRVRMTKTFCIERNPCFPTEESSEDIVNESKAKKQCIMESKDDETGCCDGVSKGMTGNCEVVESVLVVSEVGAGCGTANSCEMSEPVREGCDVGDYNVSMGCEEGNDDTDPQCCDNQRGVLQVDESPFKLNDTDMLPLAPKSFKPVQVSPHPPSKKSKKSNGEMVESLDMVKLSPIPVKRQMRAPGLRPFVGKQQIKYLVNPKVKNVISVSPSAPTDEYSEDSSHNFVGFKTAAGCSISVSAAAMERAKKIILSPQINALTDGCLEDGSHDFVGFKTAAGCSISVSAAAMERAKKIISSPEINALTDGCLEDSSHDFVGFKTAAGCSISVSAAAMERAKKIISSPEINALTDGCLKDGSHDCVGFKTAADCSISVSAAAMERAKKRILEEDANFVCDETYTVENQDEITHFMTTPELKPVTNTSGLSFPHSSSILSPSHKTSLSNLSCSRTDVPLLSHKTPLSIPSRSHSCSGPAAYRRARSQLRNRQPSKKPFKAPRMSCDVSEEEERASLARILKGFGISGAMDNKSGTLKSVFSTANGKQLTVPLKAMLEAKRRLGEDKENLDGSTSKKAISIVSATVKDMENAGHLRDGVNSATVEVNHLFPIGDQKLSTTFGFHTASGEDLPVMPKALQTPESIVASTSKTICSDFGAESFSVTGFRTAGGKDISVSINALKRVQDICGHELLDHNAEFQMKHVDVTRSGSVSRRSPEETRNEKELESDGVIFLESFSVEDLSPQGSSTLAGGGKNSFMDGEHDDMEDSSSCYFSTQVVRQFLNFSTDEENSGTEEDFRDDNIYTLNPVTIESKSGKKELLPSEEHLSSQRAPYNSNHMSEASQSQLSVSHSPAGPPCDYSHIQYNTNSQQSQDQSSHSQQESQHFQQLCNSYPCHQLPPGNLCLEDLHDETNESSLLSESMVENMEVSSVGLSCNEVVDPNSMQDQRPFLKNDDILLSDLHSQPVADLHSQPVTDLHSQPVADLHSQPVADLLSQPVADLHSQPVADLHSQLVADFHSQPVADLHSQPVADLHSQPVADLHSQPVADLHSQPVTDLHSQPVADLHSQPVTDLHSQPVADLHSQPVTDLHSQPVHDLHSQPVTDLHSQPVTDLYSQPVTSISGRSEFPCLQTASGKEVDISQHAISAVKHCLDTASTTPISVGNSLHLQVCAANCKSPPVQSLFNAESQDNLHSNVDFQLISTPVKSGHFPRAFTTAERRKVDVSIDDLMTNFGDLPGTIHSQMEIEDIDATVGAMESDKDLDSFQCSASPVQVLSNSFPGLQTASGKKVTVSEDSIRAAKLALGNDDITPPHHVQQRSSFPGLQTASGKKVTVSEDSIRAAKVALGNDDITPPHHVQQRSSFPGLQTASGKKVTVSEDSIRAAKVALGNDDITPPHHVQQRSSFPGLQTASGKKVTVSDDCMRLAKTSLRSNNLQTASDKKGSFSEDTLEPAMGFVGSVLKKSSRTRSSTLDIAPIEEQHLQKYQKKFRRSLTSDPEGKL